MMKKAGVCLILFLACSHLSQGESWAFVGVNVIPMDRPGVLKDQTVLVEDGRVSGIGPVGAVPLPAGVRRIEGEDRYLMPGLAEMHAHIPHPSQGQAQQNKILGLFVVNGVTTVRSMLGHPQHLELQQSIRDGEHPLAPRIISSGPSFNGNSVDSVDGAKEKVTAQKNAGYDFLKIHPGLSRDEFDAMAAQAKQENITFAGHVPLDVGLARALEVQQSTIDHLDGYMQAIISVPENENAPDDFFGVFASPYAVLSKILTVARQTAEAKVWNVPTQTLIENVFSAEDPQTLAAWPEMGYMSEQTVANWINAKQSTQSNALYNTGVAQQTIFVRRVLIKALHDAGAGLLLGSDAPQIFNVPGFAAHRELGVLVKAGLTPFEALETGTKNPAVFLGEEGVFGTIKEDARADLILLRGNPLEDIANTQRIDGVMLYGRWLDRGDLDRILEDYERK